MGTSSCASHTAEMCTKIGDRQAMLAEMIGTRRERVSFFMNKFRKLGLLDYNGELRIYSSLLSVVLNDQSNDHNA